MAKTKVRKDSHSLYFRTDGRVFRPFATRDSYAYHNSIKAGKTKFEEDQEVKVGLQGRSPLARIYPAHINIKESGIINSEYRYTREFWSNHGTYREKSSEECWVPEYRKEK